MYDKQRKKKIIYPCYRIIYTQKRFAMSVLGADSHHLTYIKGANKQNELFVHDLRTVRRGRTAPSHTDTQTQQQRWLPAVLNDEHFNSCTTWDQTCKRHLLCWEHLLLAGTRLMGIVLLQITYLLINGSNEPWFIELKFPLKLLHKSRKTNSFLLQSPKKLTLNFSVMMKNLIF